MGPCLVGLKGAIFVNKIVHVPLNLALLLVQKKGWKEKDFNGKEGKREEGRVNLFIYFSLV